MAVKAKGTCARHQRNERATIGRASTRTKTLLNVTPSESGHTLRLPSTLVDMIRKMWVKESASRTRDMLRRGAAA
jgi:hypothetical protein